MIRPGQSSQRRRLGSEFPVCVSLSGEETALQVCSQAMPFFSVNQSLQTEASRLFLFTQKLIKLVVFSVYLSYKLRDQPTVLLVKIMSTNEGRNRDAVVALCGGQMAQRPNYGNQCSVPVTRTQFSLTRELHLLAPEPSDVSVAHLDWNSDFNRLKVESDYLRSMLSHLMR